MCIQSHSQYFVRQTSSVYVSILLFTKPVTFKLSASNFAALLEIENIAAGIAFLTLLYYFVSF